MKLGAWLRCIVLIAAWPLAAPTALAQSYPDRTVKITMPHSGGSAPAIFLRLIANKLAQAWHQQVLVESRPGASGSIAIEAVEGAAPDGYELLGVANSHMTMCLTQSVALAQSWPVKPIRVVIPFTAGSATDVLVCERSRELSGRRT